jgi:hypothetical protein
MNDSRTKQCAAARSAARLTRLLLAIGVSALAATTASAQLIVTEMMINPKSDGDVAWEWIEVFNSGGGAIDLDGAIFGKLAEAENTTTNISSATASNTSIPAGAAAVLYNGVPSGFNDGLFRSAWGLPASVPLIAVEGFPELSNSGTNRNFGLWPSETAYRLTLSDDGMGTMRVSGFGGTSLHMNYAAGFPSTSASGPSLAWNGAGSYQDGANWSLSEAGGANVTSVPVIQSDAPLNDTDDIANPGRVPPGSAAPGLLITEIMYDPASSDASWEWVEIFNSTGQTVNFSATPYVFHDTTTANSGDLEAPNVAAGVLPHGKAAVLFSSTLTTQHMIDAWDPGGALGTLFIPVDEFPSLSNEGDTIALWDDFSVYASAAASTDPARTTDGAIAVVAYDDATPAWPANNDKASIYLSNLVLPPSAGSSWSRSQSPDSVGSANATAALADVPLHPGGDVGSPGTFGAVVPPTGDADFDDDGDVDGRDFLVWQRGLGVGASHAAGDADGNGSVDAADLAIWRGQFGAPAVAATVTTPEPTALLLAGFGVIASQLARRRRFPQTPTAI